MIARFIMLCLAMALTTVARERHRPGMIVPDLLPVPAAPATAPCVPDVVKQEVDLAVNIKKFAFDRQSLVSRARTFLGCRYAAGRRGPDRFDCSGFTGYVYELEGIKLGRSSRDQYREGIPVLQSTLLPGDLVFFGPGGSSRNINHVGMVVEAEAGGAFRFIHAASTGIIISHSTEAFWRNRYVGARRIIGT